MAAERIDGVEAAAVSLNQGVVLVSFAPDHRVTIREIREVIRANGFTPKTAEVRIEGRLVRRAETMLLDVPGSAESYRLDASDRPGILSGLRSLADGTRLALTALVPETARADAAAPVPLVVRSYTVADPRTESGAAASRR